MTLKLLLITFWLATYALPLWGSCKNQIGKGSGGRILAKSGSVKTESTITASIGGRTIEANNLLQLVNLSTEEKLKVIASEGIEIVVADLNPHFLRIKPDKQEMLELSTVEEGKYDFLVQNMQRKNLGDETSLILGLATTLGEFVSDDPNNARRFLIFLDFAFNDFTVVHEYLHILFEKDDEQRVVSFRGTYYRQIDALNIEMQELFPNRFKIEDLYREFDKNGRIKDKEKYAGDAMELLTDYIDAVALELKSVREVAIAEYEVMETQLQMGVAFGLSKEEYLAILEYLDTHNFRLKNLIHPYDKDRMHTTVDTLAGYFGLDKEELKDELENYEREFKAAENVSRDMETLYLRLKEFYSQHKVNLRDEPEN